MATLTASQIYTLLLQGGFDPQQARMMTAIAQAESARNPGAIGDVALQNGTWGPSVGLFQIRTLKSETGTGSDRDIQRLMNNPAEQVQGGAEHLRGRQQLPAVEHLHQRGVPQVPRRAAAGRRRAPVDLRHRGLRRGPLRSRFGSVRRRHERRRDERRRPLRDGAGAPAVGHHGPGRRRADRRLREALRHRPDEGRLRRRRPDRRARDVDEPHRPAVGRHRPRRADRRRRGGRRFGRGAGRDPRRGPGRRLRRHRGPRHRRRRPQRRLRAEVRHGPAARRHRPRRPVRRHRDRARAQPAAARQRQRRPGRRVRRGQRPAERSRRSRRVRGLAGPRAWTP